ncbi:MAG: hypothetical protein HUU02_07985 [Bacteroidetes bacterium]|nr:hypothetical protein [Bacteroidota bacterium]
MEQKNDKLMPALYGGLLIATIWAVPGLNFLNGLCCAGVMLGGFVAVLLYQQQKGEGSVPMVKDDCLQLGMYAGVIGAVAGVIIQYVVLAVFGDVMLEMMLRIVERMAVDLPPDFYDMIETARQTERTPVSFVLDVILMGMVNSIFSVFGALIGWKVFRPQA